MSADLISVNQAARKYGHDATMIKTEIDEGRIRHAERRATGWILLRESEFVEDLARLDPCQASGCNAPTLRASGLCRAHESELLSLTTAGRRHGHSDPKALSRAIDMGRIRCVVNMKARKIILVRESEFVEDLAALPICRLEGCGAAVLPASDYCREHFNRPGLEHADRAKRRAKQEARGDSAWLPVALFAELAGLSEAIVYRDAQRGALPSKIEGAYRLIARESLGSYRTQHVARPRPTREELESRRSRTVELFHQDVPPSEIAQELGCARNTACGYLEQAGIDRPRRRSARKLSAVERALQTERAKLLYEAGWTRPDIAEDLGVSRTQVNNYLASFTPPGPPPYRCQFCGEEFTPRPHAPKDPDFVTGRFCSIRCARAMVRTGNQEALAERGLQGVLELAERLDLSPCRVYDLKGTGLITGERVNIPGQGRPVWGATEAEAKRFEREWAGGQGSGREQRSRWQRPDDAVQQLRSNHAIERQAVRHGLSIFDTEAIARARVSRRAKRLAQHRKGRKRRSAPPEHHLRWQARYDELEAELLSDWELKSNLLGDAAGPRPTSGSIRKAVALEDWSQHQEQWPREGWKADPWDPEMLDRKLHGEAAERIRTALKRLQNERSAIPVG